MTTDTTALHNRVDRMFERCRSENRAALILYLTTGFPDAQTTRRLLPVLEASGCDLVELGVPFSDPIADGPTIQKASTIALQNGMTVAETLRILTDFRSSSDMPVILFGAVNPFLRQGLSTFLRQAAEAGADGILAADLPHEEAAEMRTECTRHGLHLISLIAPTSPDDRIAAIASGGTGFLYCIAVKGITGARSKVGVDVGPYLERIRAHTSIPRALGFGISTPEHVAAMAPSCEGVVVGSALITLVETCHREGLDLEREVGAYVRSLADALKR